MLVGETDLLKTASPRIVMAYTRRPVSAQLNGAAGRGIPTQISLGCSHSLLAAATDGGEAATAVVCVPFANPLVHARLNPATGVSRHTTGRRALIRRNDFVSELLASQLRVGGAGDEIPEVGPDIADGVTRYCRWGVQP